MSELNSAMKHEVYAYQTWRCSECGGEPVEERTDTYDLRCHGNGSSRRRCPSHDR